MPHFGQHIPPTGEPQVQGATLGELAQPAPAPAAPTNPGSAILSLLSALQPDLAGALGMPSAMSQMMALQQQAGQMQQGGSPLTDILAMQGENPALGFGAGMLKGPGPKLRLLEGGVPTGVERTTRMQPKLPLRQEVVEFPEGGLGAQPPRPPIERLLDEIRASLRGVDMPPFVEGLKQNFLEEGMANMANVAKATGKEAGRRLARVRSIFDSHEITPSQRDAIKLTRTTFERFDEVDKEVILDWFGDERNFLLAKKPLTKDPASLAQLDGWINTIESKLALFSLPIGKR